MGKAALAGTTACALIVGALACSPENRERAQARAPTEEAGAAAPLRVRRRGGISSLPRCRATPDQRFRVRARNERGRVRPAPPRSRGPSHRRRRRPTLRSVPVLGRSGGRVWSPPELLSVSGRFHDYEPTVSPDGRWMVFNSKRPGPDGRVPELNDLWIAERSGAGWAEPRRIDELDTVENEESYASFGPDGSLVFHGRVEGASGPQSDLFITRLRGGVFRGSRCPDGRQLGPGRRRSLARGRRLLSPVHPLDEEVGWAATSDLWVAFPDGDGWTTPVPLPGVNSDGADYAPTVSPDGQTLYVRVGGPYTRRPLPPLLAEARRAAGLDG